MANGKWARKPTATDKARNEATTKKKKASTPTPSLRLALQVYLVVTHDVVDCIMMIIIVIYIIGCDWLLGHACFDMEKWVESRKQIQLCPAVGATVDDLFTTTL